MALRPPASQRTPPKLVAMLRKAVDHHRGGDLVAAERLYRQTLLIEPHQADALNLLGVIALSRGKTDEAVRLNGKAATLRPKEPAILSNFGNALKAAGKLDDAHRLYRDALGSNPRFVPALINIGLLLSESGRAIEAIPHLLNALAADPRSADAQVGLADAYRLAGRAPEAERTYRDALALHPKLADAATKLASLLADQDRFAEAYAFHDMALAVDPGRPAYLGALAQTAYRAGDLDRTVAAYHRSLELEPGSGAHWNELGRALRALGDLKEAEQCFRRALECDSALTDARRNIALIGTRADAREEAALRAIVSDPQARETDRILAGFALGKLCDDDARYDDAFNFYAQANTLRREAYKKEGQVFDRDRFRRAVSQALNAKPDLNVPDPSLSEMPVFVVGMPRSGTSLVEQILASHTSVVGAGELRHIKSLTDTLSRGDDAMTAHEIARVISRLEELGRGATRVIDKMPDNIWHLRTIEQCLPQARVIFCSRHALDTCLSCYFQFFTAANLFSYDLRDCGIRHVGAEKVMAHGMKTTSLKWTSVTYEDVVEDLEGESRRLLDFLGLPWDPACLKFYKTQRSVQTASGWQVRQALFRSSVGRWKHYEAHLGGLIDVMNAER